MIVELIGILATLIVLLSFLFNKMKTIRIINIIGCICFIVYGVLINSFSVYMLNGILLIIHIIKLIKGNKDG